MRTLKQSSTAQPLVFLMVLASDHITGATGLSPTVTLSKNGGSFNAAAGAVTEIANGWYRVAGNATDTNTLGPLILHASAGTADPVDIMFDIVAYDMQDSVRLGLTALPNAAANANGGLPILSSAGTTLAYTVSTLTTYTGNTPQTGDAYARIGAAGAGLTALGDTRIAFLDVAVSSRSTFAGGAVASVTGDVGGSVLGSVQSVSDPVSVDEVGENAITSLSFAAGALDAVWSVAARTLTAGTNIVLPSNGLSSVVAWTVAITGNITGNLSGSVGSVTGAVGSVTGNVGGIAGTTQTLDALQTALNSAHGAGSWATATGFSTLTAADVRTAIGIASANLDTQLAALSTSIGLRLLTSAYTAPSNANIATILAEIDKVPRAGETHVWTNVSHTATTDTVSIAAP